MLDYMLDDEEIISSKKRKKKTLSDLLDKYGSVEGIDKNADVRDSYDYMFANTDNLIDEVMAERNASSEQNLPEKDDDFEDIEVESKKTEIDINEKYADIPKDSDGNPRYVFVEDLKTDGLTLTREKREEIKNLNTIDRFNEIKKLRKQQGVSTSQTDTHSKNELDILQERVDKANREIKIADNEYAGTRSDAEYSKEQVEDELKVDESKFNQDVFINKTMRPIIEDNEGITSYPYLDTEGLITIGVGANIDDNPLSMDWYYKNPKTGELCHLDKNNPDDLKLIKEEINKLRKAPKGKRSGYYEKITNLRVSGKYVNTEYNKRAKEAFNNIQSTINRYNKDLKKENDIPDFHKLPQPLQIVLIDMMYNMGQTRFDYITHTEKDGKKRGYPRFWDAVANRDLASMIKECARDGLPKRNKEIRDMLKKLEKIRY